MILVCEELEFFLVTKLLFVVDELPVTDLTGAEVFLLTVTVSGILSRLPPRTLISLLGAEALRVVALAAVFTLVDLIGPVRVVRKGLADDDTGVLEARNNFPAVSL